MTDKFHMEPDALHAVSADLSNVQGQVADAMSALRAKLDALGSVWGNGPIGEGFANSANGHQVRLEGFDGLAKVIADGLEGCASQLRQTANTCEQLDSSGLGDVAMVRQLPIGVVHEGH